MLAYGAITINGQLFAQGAAGQPGGAGGSNTSANRTTGGFGIGGDSGQLGRSGSADSSGSGGDGGSGGNGGDGGFGGVGGAGGNGGAGSGGTIKLFGSVVTTNGASIKTSGGDGSRNTDGRFILAANNAGASNGLSLVGGRTENFAGQMNRNPHIVGQPFTPRLPNLAGGADAFGVLANLDGTHGVFAGVRGSAPENALAALIVASAGLPGYTTVFPGYEMVALVNFDQALVNPRIGFASGGSPGGFAAPLVEGGYTHDPLFGGLPAVQLGSLEANAIYAFLVPEGALLQGTFNVFAGGNASLEASLPFGGVAYLTHVPEPGSLGLLGAAGVMLLRRRR